MKARIAVSGKSGCGNTTVSRLVASSLGLDFINFTFRNLAEERGIALEEVLRRAAEDDGWDHEVDTRQIALARQSEKGCVLGSRLAIWLLEDAALKVYLYADAQTRVRRILQREGGDFAAVAAFTAARDKQDSERYKRLYGIDNDDYSPASLVIDTGKYAPDEIASMIISALNDADTARRV
jgi:cytidylate kinase